MGILKPGVMGILNIHSDIGILNILEVTSFYEYSKNDVILNIKNNVTMNIQNTHGVSF